MMRATLLGATAFAAFLGAANAGPAVPARTSAVAGTPIIRVDWQDPARLPRRFRNHCVAEPASGRTYCENHCGRGYEFYYCSSASSGCCHVGYGYCDGHGELRCHP
ncbi:MAG TPA: hypothetical protein VGG01_18775 [Xanthobacteraceae bacterium]|jgi:hypothetical protein